MQTDSYSKRLNAVTQSKRCFNNMSLKVCTFMQPGYYGVLIWYVCLFFSVCLIHTKFAWTMVNDPCEPVLLLAGGCHWKHLVMLTFYINIFSFLIYTSIVYCCINNTRFFLHVRSSLPLNFLPRGWNRCWIHVINPEALVRTHRLSITLTQ